MTYQYPRFRRLLALLLQRVGSRRIVGGREGSQFREGAMDEKIERGAQGLACRASREESEQKDKEYRERVRAAVERVRSQNREILDRLATK